MDAHKKPRHGGNVPGLSFRPSISVLDSNTLITAVAVFWFAMLGAAMGHAIDGMARDLTAGPVPGGRADGQ